jgi:hypothetical protein
MRRLLALSALVLVACTREYTAIEPVGAEVRVIVTLAKERSSVRALANDEPLRFELGELFDQKGEIQVWVFGYSAEALVEAFPGLAGRTGEQIASMLAPALGDEEGRVPPIPDHVLRAAIEREASGEVTYTEASWQDWIALVDDGTAPRLTFAPPAPENPCGPEGPKLAFDRLVLDAWVDTRFAVPLADGSVIVGAPDAVHRIAPDRSVTRLEMPAGLPLHAAASSDGVTVWFGYDVLAKARVDTEIRELTVFGPPPGEGVIFRIAVLGDEVYVLQGGGTFSRFDGTMWTVLHRFPQLTTYSGVIAIAPGRAAAVSGQSTEVARYESGETIIERVEGARSGVSTIASIEGIGLIAGTSVERDLYLRDETGWKPFPDSFTDVLPCGAIGFLGGIFVVGQFGYAALYVPGKGVCFRGALGTTTQHWPAPLAGGILISGDSSSSGVVLTLVSEAP